MRRRYPKAGEVWLVHSDRTFHYWTMQVLAVVLAADDEPVYVAVKLDQRRRGGRMSAKTITEGRTQVFVFGPDLTCDCEFDRFTLYAPSRTVNRYPTSRRVT